MSSNILNYCGVKLKTTGSEADASASTIAAQWNTGIGLWDQGDGNRYLRWGDTEGTLNIFDLELTPVTGDVTKVVNNYATAVTATIYTDNSDYEDGADTEVIDFTACLYNTGATQKQLKPLGDRYVIEGAVDFKIFKSNDA